MGWRDNLRGNIRQFMAHDRENMMIRAAHGQTASTIPNSTLDLVQSYGYDVVSDHLRLEQDLTAKFVDYEGMDEYPETSALYTIYADDATQPDMPSDRRIWVTSPDRSIEMMLNDLLIRQMRIQDDLWPMARSLCKMGNLYEEIVVGQYGVIGLNPMPAHTVRRVEGMRGELYGFVQDFQRRAGYTPREFQGLMAKRNMSASKTGLMLPGQGVGPPITSDLDEAVPFENWQVMHCRLQFKQRKSLYGQSVLDSARWIWKRLMLLEDSALIYRLQRAAERYIYYVNTGTAPPKQAISLLKQIEHRVKKRQYVNPTTNELDLKYTLIAPQNDLFIPAYDGEPTTRVDLLSSPNWQHMDDIEYFLRKLFSAAHVPRAYLSHEDGINRAILSAEDVRFARTILRIQNELKQGIEKVCRVHLAALGIPPHEVEFKLHMTTPSSIFELAQIEVKNARADLGMRMLEQTSLRYVLETVHNLSTEDIDTIFQQREEEAKLAGIAEGKRVGMSQKYAAPPGQPGGGAFGGGPGGGESPGGGPPAAGGGAPGGGSPEGGGAQGDEVDPAAVLDPGAQLPGGDLGDLDALLASRGVHPDRARGARAPSRPTRYRIDGPAHLRNSTWQMLNEGRVLSSTEQRAVQAQLQRVLATNKRMEHRMNEVRGLLADVASRNRR